MDQPSDAGWVASVFEVSIMGGEIVTGVVVVGDVEDFKLCNAGSFGLLW